MAARRTRSIAEVKARNGKGAKGAENPEPTAEDRAKAEIARIATLTRRARTLVAHYRHALEPRMPDHIERKRFMAIVESSIARKPEVAELLPEDVLPAIAQCIELGLEPDTIRDQCYIIARWNGKKQRNEAQVLLGYRGRIDLFFRAMPATGLDFMPVFENDDFYYRLGTNMCLDHRPADSNPGALTHAWAMAAWDGNRGRAIKVLNLDDIQRIKIIALGAELADDPDGRTSWHTDLPQMAAKSAANALLSRLPNNPQRPVPTRDAYASATVSTLAAEAPGIILDAEAISEEAPEPPFETDDRDGIQTARASNSSTGQHPPANGA